MPRDTSAAFKQAAFAPQTSEAVLELVTIDHGLLASPLRFVNNGENIISNGNTYLATRFGLSIPSESEDQPPKCRLQICNVDKQIMETVRSLDTPPSLKIEIVLSSDPDTVELSLDSLKFKDVSYDAGIIEGTLGFEDTLSEPFPGDLFAPYAFPGLFGTTA